MPQTSTRLIRGNLSWAARTPPVFTKARASKLTPTQASGVRYENRLHKALDILAKSLGARLESNPWFKFCDSNGTGACSPDALLWIDDSVLVIEAKYTWVPTAAPKLRGLYIPVVQKVLSPNQIRSAIVCKVLTPESPMPKFGLGSPDPKPFVYQWTGQGPLCW